MMSSNTIGVPYATGVPMMISTHTSGVPMMIRSPHQDAAQDTHNGNTADTAGGSSHAAWDTAGAARGDPHSNETQNHTNRGDTDSGHLPPAVCEGRGGPGSSVQWSVLPLSEAPPGLGGTQWSGPPWFGLPLSGVNSGLGWRASGGSFPPSVLLGGQGSGLQWSRMGHSYAGLAGQERHEWSGMGRERPRVRIGKSYSLPIISERSHGGKPLLVYTDGL